MKYRTTAKAVRENCDCVQIGYCDAYNILCGLSPNAYTCGVYGWNADIYNIGGKAIVTGYRPFGRAPRVNVHEWDKRARAIMESRKDYDERLEEIAALRKEFMAVV